MANSSKLNKDNNEEFSKGYLPSDDDLRHLTGINKEQEEAHDREAKKGADEDIAKQERSFSTESGNDGGGFYSPDDSESPSEEDEPKVRGRGLKGLAAAGMGLAGVGEAKLLLNALGKAGKFFGGSKKRRKATLIGGGAIGGIALLVISGFTFLATHALVTIEKVMLREETKIEQRFERKAAKSLATDLICKALPINSNLCNNSAAAEDAANTTEESGMGLTEDINKFSFDDPVVKNLLADNGFEVKNGGIIIDSSTGAPVTAEQLDSSSLGDSFVSALKETQVGTINSYAPTMAEDANVNESGVTEGEDAKQTEQTIDQEAIQGESATQSLASDGISENSPSSDPKIAAQQQADFAKGGVGEAGSAISATDQALANGESASSAIDAGVKAFGGINPLLLSSLATTACTIKDTIQSTALQRLPEIASMLMRYGNLLPTLADQLKTGHITSTQVATIMKGFMGNSAAKRTKYGTLPVSALPFSRSAAWFRANNLPITSTTDHYKGYTPDINPMVTPTPNSATSLLNEINNIPGMNLFGWVCGGLTSWLGFIVQGGIGAFQLGSEIGQCSTIVDCAGGAAEQAAIGATIYKAQSVIQHNILPDVLKAFTPVGIIGATAPDKLNNMDAGLNISYNDYSRHLGALPISSSEASSLSTKANSNYVADLNNKPLSYRLFSFNDPYSLFSRLSLALPLSLEGTFSRISSFILSFPKIIGSVFSSLFVGKISATSASTNSQPWQAYQTQEYGMTNSQAGAYDPIQNEDYLFTNVKYKQNGSTYTIQRIKALGNPDINGKPITPNTDFNYQDLYHCFNLSFNLLMTNTTNSSTANTNKNFPHATPDTHCGQQVNGEYYGLGQLSGNLSSGGSSQTQAMNQQYSPTNNTVANIYCEDMGFKSTNPKSPQYRLNCTNYLFKHGQINNDLARYQQYILDTQVMANYLSLAQAN